MEAEAYEANTDGDEDEDEDGSFWGTYVRMGLQLEWALGWIGMELWFDQINWLWYG